MATEALKPAQQLDKLLGDLKFHVNDDGKITELVVAGVAGKTVTLVRKNKNTVYVNAKTLLTAIDALMYLGNDSVLEGCMEMYIDKVKGAHPGMHIEFLPATDEEIKKYFLTDWNDSAEGNNVDELSVNDVRSALGI